MQITKNQKKIIIIALCAVSVLFITLFLSYFPAQRTVNKLKGELAGIEKQIHEIESIIGQAKTKDEGVRLLKDLQSTLTRKFPAKEEEGIKMLSEYARKLGIEVVSINPGMKTNFLDSSGRPLTIEGRACLRMPVNLELRSTFKDLVKYIKVLSDEIPVFVFIQNLEIAKDGSSLGRVNAVINLELFLIN